MYFSDETTAVNHSGLITQITSSDCDGYGWRRPRSESSADAESVYMTNAVLSDSGYAQQSRRSSVSARNVGVNVMIDPKTLYQMIKQCFFCKHVK